MLKKSLKIIAIFIIAILMALLAAAWWFIRSPQANEAGVITLPTLKQNITITRNAQGVPHIEAASVDDAYYAMGFVHAQDRLWQMMFHRRVAQGRLSEVLGDATLETDKFIRTLGVMQRAQAAVKEYDAQSLVRMQRYAEGVNAFLDTRQGALPIEFTLTGAPAPEPWTVEDSAAWTVMMAWDLGANWRRELRRLMYAQSWSVAKINDLMRPYEDEQPLETVDYAALYKQLGIYGSANNLAQAAPAMIAAAPESGIEGIGSNNWVLAGSRTTSGKPLLANDPHLGLSTPSLWYLVSVSAGKGADAWQAVGASIPAMPGIILGRNAHLAWGFTNTGPDVQDTFIERINPANSNEYQTPAGWAAFTQREEVIKVKGKLDVRINARSTRHGAVISDVFKAGTLPALKETLAQPYVLALQWTALMPGDLSGAASVQLAHAKNWDEFLSTAKNMHAPQQNVVYADVAGNIGYIAAGRVPVRKAANDLKGLAPALGWEAKYDWDGWIPFDKLPRQFNPGSGVIATANEKINQVGDPFLTSEWALPYRAQRIKTLLASKEKHNIASVKTMQTDAESLAVAKFLSLAAPLIKDNALRHELANFDSNMQANRGTPLLATALWRHTAKRLFMDDLGEKAYVEAADPSMLWQPMLAALAGKSSVDWCDDIRTPEKETCTMQVNAALADAVAELTSKYGAASQWQWGKAHALQADHRVFGSIPALTRFFSSTVPLSGDAFTVMQMKHMFGKETTPYAATHGPGYRGIFDLSVPIAQVIHTTGQSGLMGHSQYKDLLGAWAKGDTLALPVGAASETDNAPRRWVLKAPSK